MDFIFGVLQSIGSTIASFYAAHPLAAAILTIVAFTIFWKLMGWGKKPDFSDKQKLAKNGLIVLVGWAVAVPIFDLILKVLAKLLDGAVVIGKSIAWIWDRFNEQPIVVLSCLAFTIIGFFSWKYFAKKPETYIRVLCCILGFVVLVAVAVPIANSLTKEKQQPAKQEVSAPSA